MTPNQWNDWSKNLWNEAEDRWRLRVGQDDLYRESCVLPVLARTISCAHHGPIRLVDIGCGDGRNTARLVGALDEVSVIARQIILIDRRAGLLAGTRDHLELTHAVRIPPLDILEKTDWTEAFMDQGHPTIYIAEYVIQELANTTHLFRALAGVLRPQDLFVAVVPDPQFAQNLMLQDGVKSAVCDFGRAQDWQWAGRYPICENGSSFYLPYFHRTLEMLATIAQEAGLKLRTCSPVVLPATEENKKAYHGSPYAPEIFTRTSSQVIAFGVSQEGRR